MMLGLGFIGIYAMLWEKQLQILTETHLERKKVFHCCFNVMDICLKIYTMGGAWKVAGMVDSIITLNSGHL